jgi:hypothetical protein
MGWTTVPKTAIDKYRNSPLREDNIGTDAPTSIKLDEVILSEAIPATVQGRSNSRLWLGTNLSVRSCDSTRRRAGRARML